ncbi:HAD family hydrolase [Shewanella sp. SR43-4]|uniref:HAD family hydrolase n=1 Tax=unclassified Shewanella TaxID=196818 RepID=UPI0015F9395E|nr:MULTISPECIES: HAD family hydrolase [unclassified Shewanella]MBB1316092.1 HAD family hydrolase [Shewanella sp. SR43-4]MBB1387956.1 HAD family hydrolase [Shewanella sp. SG44-6]
MNLPMQIKGIIFDLDGTLVESNLDFNLIRQQIGCPDSIDLLKYVDELSCKDTQASANQIILDHEYQDAINAKPIKGMAELINAIEAAKLPTAIVTRNSLAASAMKVKQNNIAINHVLTREDYPAKPAPDALLAIATQWQISPQHIIYVGDYLYDIQAANNAGMIACFINHGVDSEYQHLADIIINDLSQLQQLLVSHSHND